MMLEFGLAAIAAQVFAVAIFCAGAFFKKRKAPTYRLLCVGMLAIMAGSPLLAFALRDAEGAAAQAAFVPAAAAATEETEAAGKTAEGSALSASENGSSGFILAAYGAVRAAAIVAAVAGFAGLALSLRDWISFAAWKRKAIEASERTGSSGRVQIRSWRGPAFACGFLKPVVFLPQEARAVEGTMRAMEEHELAHARSGHFMWNALQSFLARLLWWNPLQGRLLGLGRTEREIEADSLAAESIGSLAYAQALVIEAERGARSAGEARGPALVSAWDSNLTERMRSLSNRRHDGPGAKALRVAFIALALGIAWAGGNAVIPLAPPLFAQEPAAAVSLFPATGRAARVSLGFGERMNPITQKPYFHEGIDLYALSGEAVGSWAPGRVAEVGEDEYSGIYVEVEHANGFRSRYAHLSKATAQEGSRLDRGGVLGAAGSTGRSTGPHLHFALFKDGKAVDPSAFVLIEPAGNLY